MDSRLKVLLVILLYLVMPVLMGYIIVKLFVSNKGTILAIAFIILVIIGITVPIIRLIKSRRE